MSEPRRSNILEDLTRLWHNRLFLSRLLTTLAIAFVAFAFARQLVGAGIVPAVATSASAAVLFWLLFRRRGHKKLEQPNLVAQHLDRTVPELEESCELLLKPERALSPLERLQVKRVLTAVGQLPKDDLLPRLAVNRAWKLFVVCLGLLVLSSIVPGDRLRATRESDRSAAVEPVSGERDVGLAPPLEVESVLISVRPPAYTGQKQRSLSQFDVLAEDGSELSWTVQFNQGARAAALVFSPDDTLSLNSREMNQFEGTRLVRESKIYYLLTQARDGRIQSSKYYKLDVTPDLPPTIIVLEPEQRQEIEPGQPARAMLRVLTDDDYAVSGAEIVATVTKGSGEGVKFREERLTFDRVVASTPGQRRTREISLEQLGLERGDELYFHVEAWDNREPTPNRSRSETHFVVLKDTSSVRLALSSGLAINPLPEYFRSQRQIIMDTEKLIREKAGLADEEFKKRSNNLGIDQKALRLRYGEFLGEEAEGFTIESSRGEGHGEHGSPESDFELAFGQDENPLEPVDPNAEKSLIPQQFRHDHDFEENATLFSESIKSQLKAALAEMWEAELHLRTFEPGEALPFEYRALVLLKRVQQASRVYVKKIGFEPPPLQPNEQRLTGDLTKIEDRTTLKTVDQTVEFPRIRRALPVLGALRRDRVLSKNQEMLLREAGRELAREAVLKPGRYLDALNDLHDVLSQVGSGDSVCKECTLRVERAFWQLLPVPHPLPSTSNARNSELSKRYFDKLGAER